MYKCVQNKYTETIYWDVRTGSWPDPAEARTKCAKTEDLTSDSCTGLHCAKNLTGAGYDCKKFSFEPFALLPFF